MIPKISCYFWPRLIRIKNMKYLIEVTIICALLFSLTNCIKLSDEELSDTSEEPKEDAIPNALGIVLSDSTTTIQAFNFVDSFNLKLAGILGCNYNLNNCIVDKDELTTELNNIDYIDSFLFNSENSNNESDTAIDLEIKLYKLEVVSNRTNWLTTIHDLQFNDVPSRKLLCVHVPNERHQAVKDSLNDVDNVYYVSEISMSLERFFYY